MTGPGGFEPPQEGRSMKHSLQRTMIVYFMLVGFASLLVGAEFAMDAHRKELKEELLSNFEKYSQGELDARQVFRPIDRLRNKAILMLGIILFVMLIVLTMFIKNITGPLQHMIEAAEGISKGDLSHTVSVRARNELARLGEVINELTSNLQEIILLSRSVLTAGRELVEKAESALARQGPDEEKLKELREALPKVRKEFRLMSQIIDYFNFYTIEGSGPRT